MFERLMNLDVELRCLGTKAFVAKEELVDKVFYPTRKNYDKKNSTSNDVEKTEKEKPEAEKTQQSEEETFVGKRGPVYEYNMRKLREEREAKEGRKPVTAEVVKPVNDKPVAARVDNEPTAQTSINELGAILETIMKNGSPEVIQAVTEGLAEAVKEMKEMADNISDIQVIEKTTTPVVPVVTDGNEKVVTGMDFSNFQQGVNYQNPVTPVQPVLSQNPQDLKPVTPEALEEALALAKEKTEKEKKKNK